MTAGEEAREKSLRDMLVRQLIVGQLYRYCSEDITQCGLLKQWTIQAKKERNKQYIDLRIPSAQCIRTIDAWAYQLSRTITKQEFADINHVLKNDSIQEMLILISMIADATAESIAGVGEVVRQHIAAAIERQSHANQ